LPRDPSSRPPWLLAARGGNGVPQALTADYRFTIENKKVGAGLHITGDRPLANVVLWSIRTALSLEPYVAMTIAPGQEFTWQYTYTFYVIDNKK
jgi:hypothetical protein